MSKLPTFTITRPAAVSARSTKADLVRTGANSQDTRRSPLANGRGHPARRSGPVLPRGLARICIVSAVVTHALGSLAGGSFNPGDWSALLLWTCILIVAPCIALAIAVVDGALR